MKKLTIPNIITFVRLFLVPIIIYFILNQKIKTALILFVISIISDMFDGFLARRLKQATYYGGVFDALTDTILIFSTVTALYLTNQLQLKFLLLLMSPKIITFILLTILNKKKFKTTIYSRLSSLVLYITIPLILLNFNITTIKILMIALYILSIIHWFLLIVKR